MLSFNKWHPIYFSLLDLIQKNKQRPFGILHTRWDIRVIIMLCILVLILTIFWLISGETKDPYPDKRTLDIDGYVVIRNTNKEKAIEYLPNGYEFIDYKYTIRGCSLSTFHRDVTSSPYIYNTKHPVYTYIEYFNQQESPLLSICPGSHITTPFLYSSPVIISGYGKTGILLHCDTVHAGAINQLGNLRYVEQYKIAHKNDIHTLSHLHNINTIKTGRCDVSPFYEYVSRRVSWIFSHIFNHHFTSYLQTKPDTHIGKMLVSFLGRDFYNKPYV